jgi:methionyl aminopeptidase
LKTTIPWKSFTIGWMKFIDLLYLADINMTNIKSRVEIETITECGKRLKVVTGKLLNVIKPGLSTYDVDAIATKYLSESSLDVSFRTVAGYSYATCLPVNNQAVHTPPKKNKILVEGDVLTVDIGGLYGGYHTDWATTLVVGKEEEGEVKRFLDTGRTALAKSIGALGVGVRLGVVGQIMQRTIESAGYKVLKNLTGHGIGKELHEDPFIPNIAPKDIMRTPIVRSGFVCAIEIIYSQSTETTVLSDDDGWSIDTSDGSLAACFEHTVAIDENGVHILT